MYVLVWYKATISSRSTKLMKRAIAKPVLSTVLGHRMRKPSNSRFDKMVKTRALQRTIAITFLNEIWIQIFFLSNLLKISLRSIMIIQIDCDSYLNPTPRAPKLHSKRNFFDSSYRMVICVWNNRRHLETLSSPMQMPDVPIQKYHVDR